MPLPFNTSLPPAGSQTLIYAHRGAMAYRPQNTMPAFELAWSMGAAGVELDVQCSLDGVPVIFHDDTLDKLSNGTGRIRDHDLSELLQLDVGSHFSPDYAGLSMPTLEDVLRARPADTFVNIELKTELEDVSEEAQALRSQTGYPVLTPQPNSDIEIEARRIAQRTALCIQTLAPKCPDLLEHLIVSSFHPAALAEFNHIMPHIAIGHLYCRSTRYDTATMMSAIPCMALHLNANEVTETIVQQTHASGKQVNCWTVNDVAQARQLMAWRVDGILSNCPDVMLALLNAHTSSGQ